MEKRLKNISARYTEGDIGIDIKFNRLEPVFNEQDRLHILHSDIKYHTPDFVWEATLPTVNIPYRDPSMGYLLGGVVFSSVGVYQRAPGVVVSPGEKDSEDYVLDIITSRNATLSIVTHRKGIQIRFKKNDKYRYVPLGVFLKAFSGLPYAEILRRIKFMHPYLQSSFPCAIPERSKDLSKVEAYGVNLDEEPGVANCIRAVYSAVMQVDNRSKNTNYSEQWQLQRIKSYFSRMHFKTLSNYEANLALHARAVGCAFDQDVKHPIFVKNEDGSVSESFLEFKRGDYIDSAVQSKLKWHDIDTLRVKTSRSFVLQEDTPMLFRIKGYAALYDIPEVGVHAGDIFDEESIKRLNASDIYMVEVRTPVGRKVISRSGEEPEIGDFVTMINTLFTTPFMAQDDTNEYEVANRIVVDYDRHVVLEVEQTYQDIITALGECRQLHNIVQSLPKLPSNRLADRLRDNTNKELAQAELTNVMSRAIAERRTSALMREAPVAMTSVQKDQYARIDSLHSPESDKVGAVQELTVMVRTNPETGELEAPYERVVNGKPTGEIEYVSAAKERNRFIAAWNESFSERTVMARCNGDVSPVDKERVSYRDVSPFCDMSVSRMTVPFPEFSQPRRSLMATKMTGQAVPLLFPERPRVSTGADMEVPCLYYTARDVVESVLGKDAVHENQCLEVVNVKWEKFVALYTCVYNGRTFTYSVPFTPTSKNTLYHYNLNHKADHLYDLDDIVFYNQSCDIGKHEYWERVEQGALPLIQGLGRPSLALGVNLTVVYKTYGSSTIDDAVVISDRLIKNRKLSSIQLEKYKYELHEGEKFSAYNPTASIHSFVRFGDPVITVVRDTQNGHKQKYVKAKQAGEVISVDLNVKTGEAEIWVATFHDSEVGDKVAGRYGNKSVIAKIIPEADMPYDPETGMSADIILSPLGIPSRMNYGQVIEVTLGAAMAAQGKYAVVTPFYPGIKPIVEDLYAEQGLACKKLYHPKYGKYTESPVMMGVMYFLKLEHMSNLKCYAVGEPKSVDPVFGQPVKSTNASNGQTIGEMETWALAAAGADKMLNSYFTLYASDSQSRKRFMEVLEANEEGGKWDERMEDCISRPIDNIDALTTQTVMRMFGQDVYTSEDNRYHVGPLNMDDIVVISSVLDLKNQSNKEEKGWFKVKLQAPTINPFWIENFPLNVVLGVKSVKTIAARKHYLDVNTREVIPEKDLNEFNRPRMITGIEAIIALINNTSIDDAIARMVNDAKAAEDLQVAGFSEDAVEGLSGPEDVSVLDDEGDEIIHVKSSDVEIIGNGYDEDNPDYDSLDLDGDFEEELNVPVKIADIVRFLRGMQARGMKLSDLIWEYMPIMPRIFRQDTIDGGISHEHSFQTQLNHICERSNSQDSYEALKQLIGFGKSRGDDLISIRGYFFGKDSATGKHGKVRKNVLSKRTGYSGRTVIVPAEDMEMSPFFVGIPWCVAMDELAPMLTIRMRKKAASMGRELMHDLPSLSGKLENLSDPIWEDIICNLGSYNTRVYDSYFKELDNSDKLFLHNYFRKVVKDICEANVTSDGRVWVNGVLRNPEDLDYTDTIDAACVALGRQPTLHKKSVRIFFMKLVDGYCTHIHPIMCSGYNADFDGDTMWDTQLFGEMKIEGWKTMSCLQDLISAKDGSYTLSLAQDITLGLYCASIFANNTAAFEGTKGSYVYFNNADKLKTELEYGNLKYSDVVIFENEDHDRYISTAGRVLINLAVPGAMTKLPFTDPHKICTQVLGEEYISGFKQLKYDTYISGASSGTVSKDRSAGTKPGKLLLDTYDAYGARESILTAQRLYEIGLAASDIYSITASMDDMSVDVDVQQFMIEPKEKVAQLATLEQMGLISESERKRASSNAWEKSRKAAQDSVIAAIPINSNTHFLMYSGARGKPDQVMQTVGFIGTIAKSTTSDIEYPILTSYGSGLNSLQASQTRYMARMGVVSTNAGTKETGYATRQTVYMSSGMGIVEDDCGIENRLVEVSYGESGLRISDPHGKIKTIDDLCGEVVDPGAECLQSYLPVLTRTGYLLTEDIVDKLIHSGVTDIPLFDRTVTLKHGISASWREHAIAEGYSYALPFTDNRKVTEATVDWIEQNGLHEVIMFDEADNVDDLCFWNEAHLPVDYDASKYTIYRGNKSIAEEKIIGRVVTKDTAGFHYYSGLLDNNGAMTMRALRYLTKKRIRSIVFEDGTSVTIRYKIAKLFTDLTLGRVSVGLPHLDKDNLITKETLDTVEFYQLEAIPVRTHLTCMSENGVCSKCHGKGQETRKFLKVGDNIGIAAAQAQCEPLSQATLDVNHSGGRRSAGVGSVSGLEYYKKMLRGSLVSRKDAHLQEDFAKVSGYVRVNKHDGRFVQIEDEDGKVLSSMTFSNPDRCNVPDGVYVDEGDTIRNGWAVLNRYSSSDIFTSALKTRYLLIQEYHRIFSKLDVSPRNYEILAREQTSICYLQSSVNLPPKQDCSVEIKNPTGKYKLFVAEQYDVVNKYSGIAGFAFENVAKMIGSAVLDSKGLPLNSFLGNLVTGTEVGSEVAKFIPAAYGGNYKKSAVRQSEEEVKGFSAGQYKWDHALKLDGAVSVNAIDSLTDNLLQSLLALGSAPEYAAIEESAPVVDPMNLEAQTSENEDYYSSVVVADPVIEEQESEVHNASDVFYVETLSIEDSDSEPSVDFGKYNNSPTVDRLDLN